MRRRSRAQAGHPARGRSPGAEGARARSGGSLADARPSSAEAIEEVYAETVSETTGTRAPSTASRRLGGAPARIAHDDHDESDLRLRRSDIDAFEPGLSGGAGIVIVATHADRSSAASARRRGT